MTLSKCITTAQPRILKVVHGVGLSADSRRKEGQLNVPNGRLIVSRGADKILSFRKNYCASGIAPVMTAVCPPPPLIEMIFEFTGRSLSSQLSGTNTSSL